MVFAEKISEGFSDIVFQRQFIDQLPADPNLENNRRQVENACYSKVNPTNVTAPERVVYSSEVANLLGFSKLFCDSEIFTRTFAGNHLLPGMSPYAMCYGGHQFGSWAGQLGDGRAINLGEILHPGSGRWTLQLKGAGPTPYSRTADGLAVLRSSIREFLCSEAMFHLGVPTTRALGLILTGEQVERDMFYDGHPKLEPGAVVCRVSPSFTRFGNFEIHAARNELDLLKTLADFTIKTDFPHLFNHGSASGNNLGPEEYIKWFEDICKKTADMVIHWMRVGFVHGVMNTDNMSILGLTIDYGPYGWLEDYNPAWTPNTTDAKNRRYCFGNQPKIAQWNLAQLANAIFPLIGSAEPLQGAINNFWKDFETGWQTMMAQKLGIEQFDSKIDTPLITDLLEILAVVETDFTIFFRNLARLKIDLYTTKAINLDTLANPLLDAYYQPEQRTAAYQEKFNLWLDQYARRISKDNWTPKTRQKTMNQINPKYVLRNYLCQMAIEQAEQNKYSMIHELMDVMRHPYQEQPQNEKFAEKRPEWARSKPGCSMLSCSS